MSTTRRRFLGVGLAGLAAIGASHCRAGEKPANRKALARRRRRIIFNDDGDDVWHPNAATPEGFISVRLQHMLNTQVDTLFYCTTQSFNYYSHNTHVGEVFLSKSGPFQHNNMQTLLGQGTDPLDIAVRFAHENGIEAIWTLRMNDIHDAFTPPLWPRWKTDHPDALLGKRADWSANPPGSQARWWSGVNFNRADVRQRTIAFIEEAARNYDLDGIDLDWLRNPIFFPETRFGKPASAKDIGLLTQLVRDVRKTLDRVEHDRAKPILLSVRVPMTLAHGQYIGLDLETWLREELVDFVTIGGGYVPFSMPTRAIAALCHRHEVPVYPCISASGMTRRAPFGKGQLYGIEAWRAAAANAYAQGADGVSLFNLFPSPGAAAHNTLVRKAFSELGDPATLQGKDKLFCLDNAEHMKRCGYINHVVPFRDCLPKTLRAGEETVASVFVADDPTRTQSRCRLCIQIDGKADLRLSLNGTTIPLIRAPKLEQEIGLTWLTATLPSGVAKQGTNAIRVQTKGPNAKPIQLTGVEIRLCYP